MRWPWVSRVAFDVLAQSKDDMTATLTTRIHERDAWAAKAMERSDVALRARDDVIQAIERERMAERGAADKRYADLLARFVMLRLQGAVDPAPPVAIPAQPDELVRAINAKFGRNLSAKAGALRQLQADRAADKPDDEILMAIRGGIVLDLESEGVPT